MMRYRRVILFSMLFAALTMGLTPDNQPVAAAGKNLDGKWELTLTIPVAPQAREKQTITLRIDASPRGDSMHGRMLVTDKQDRVVGGVWRQVGKRVSIAIELPCSEGEMCASVVMIGKIKGEGFTKIKKGSVVVMWDTQNDENYAMYDTSNGAFSGTRIE